MKPHGAISSKYYEVRKGQVRRIYYKLPTLHIKKVDTRKYTSICSFVGQQTKNPHRKDEPETKETDYSQEVDEKGVKRRRRDGEGTALLTSSFHRTLIS